MTNRRTITSAMNPQRCEDRVEIIMTVWFDEFGDEPLTFVASPFDPERHGKELWIRAMAGEYGPITVLPAMPSPPPSPNPMKLVNSQ